MVIAMTMESLMRVQELAAGAQVQELAEGA
jgi:hypothetical protein